MIQAAVTPPKTAQAMTKAKPGPRLEVDPGVWRIAGDDGSVDGAHGHACDPVRINAGFTQCLVNSGLIRAEGPAALQRANTK